MITIERFTMLLQCIFHNTSKKQNETLQEMHKKSECVCVCVFICVLLNFLIPVQFTILHTFYITSRFLAFLSSNRRFFRHVLNFFLSVSLLNNLKLLTQESFVKNYSKRNKVLINTAFVYREKKFFFQICICILEC